MTRAGTVLVAIYGVAAAALTGLAFAGLLSRKMGFTIPIVSTHIIPALHRHAVWGETLRGRAILVGGEEWFFLIVIALVIVLGLCTVLVSRWIRSVAKPQ